VQAQFRKMPGPWAMWQCFGLIFGGPFANICAAILVLPIALTNTVTANFFAFFILASVFVGVAQLIPFTTSRWRSDGAKLFSLLFNKTMRDELIFLRSLRARVDEIKALSRDRLFQEVLNKTEELISGTERIPSFRKDVQGREKLIKFRDSLRQHLTDAEGIPPETAPNLD
jgi:hypothetical protein